ncbi:hypothetical protein [Streptomyces mirabilis]|uniref:hypothetical protein n=1 Tax=Streptomyces mirabilis TaxID=68239 RepID=UPI0031BA1CF8
MDADDRTGPREWSTTSPEHVDQLARGVLGAARDAARELRRDPPDPTRRTWTLGVLAGRRRQCWAPTCRTARRFGVAAQEEFVRTSLALAVHVRAHRWAEVDLGAAGVLGKDDVPHLGERGTADAFDVLGRLMLPHSSPEGWTATLVTDLARGDTTLEAAVKLGILHPTLLALADDATRVIGEGRHGLNVRRLKELTQALRDCAGAGQGCPVVDGGLTGGDFGDCDLDPGTVLDPAQLEVLEVLKGLSERQETVHHEQVTSSAPESAGIADEGEPVAEGAPLDELPSMDEYERGTAAVEPRTDTSGFGDPHLRGHGPFGL